MQHDGSTLGDVINEPKRPFSELRFREKVEFIWDYYKIPIALILFFVIVTASLLKHYLTSNQDVLLYGMTVNTHIDDEKAAEIPDLYMEYAAADAKKYTVNFDQSLFMGVEYGVQAETDYSTVIKLSTTIAGKMLDYLICDQYVFESYEAIAGYYDLKDLLPDDLYSRLEEEGRIIIGQADNSDSASRLDPYPMAIDITDTDFAKRYGMSPLVGDTLYFTIIANSQRTEEAVNMIRMIFGDDYVPALPAE